MKIYLLTFFICLNIFSLNAQSPFSKDIFLEKTIYAVMEEIKSLEISKRIDTLLIIDASLKSDFDQKTTTINGINLCAVKVFPFSKFKKSKIRYFLNYQTTYATDEQVFVSFNIQKCIQKKPLFRKLYVKHDPPIEYFTFILNSNISLKELLKLQPPKKQN